MYLNSDHSGLNKFDGHTDANFQLVLKGLQAIKAHDKHTTELVSHGAQKDQMSTINKYYDVPRSVSTMFTGRHDIYERMRVACCLTNSQAQLPKTQRRYVLYGIGGSGKSQLAIKFAESHQDK